MKESSKKRKENSGFRRLELLFKSHCWDYLYQLEPFFSNLEHYKNNPRILRVIAFRNLTYSEWKFKLFFCTREKLLKTSSTKHQKSETIDVQILSIFECLSWSFDFISMSKSGMLPFAFLKDMKVIYRLN